MGFDGTPPAPRRGLPLSDKAREVLAFLAEASSAADPTEGGDGGALALEKLLRALYEPAMAVATAINLVRQGNVSMGPFIGAAGVVLSQVLEPLVAYFEDGATTFEEAMERIGVPVVPFRDLPDVDDASGDPRDDDR